MPANMDLRWPASCLLPENHPDTCIALVLGHDVRLQHHAHVLLEHERRDRPPLRRAPRGEVRRQQADAEAVQERIVDGVAARVDHLGGVEHVVAGGTGTQHLEPALVGLQRDIAQRRVARAGRFADEDRPLDLPGIAPVADADLVVHHVTLAQHALGEVLPGHAGRDLVLAAGRQVAQVRQPAGGEAGRFDDRAEFRFAQPRMRAIDQRLQRRVGELRTAAQPFDLLVALHLAQVAELRRHLAERPPRQQLLPGEPVGRRHVADPAEHAGSDAGIEQEARDGGGRIGAAPARLDRGHLARVRHMVVRLREQHRRAAIDHRHVVVAVAEEAGQPEHVGLHVARHAGVAIHHQCSQFLAGHQRARPCMPALELGIGEPRVQRTCGRQRKRHCHAQPPSVLK
jgi:hypothetical protein